MYIKGNEKNILNVNSIIAKNSRCKHLFFKKVSNDVKCYTIDKNIDCVVIAEFNKGKKKTTVVCYNSNDVMHLGEIYSYNKLNQLRIEMNTKMRKELLYYKENVGKNRWLGILDFKVIDIKKNINKYYKEVMGL